MRLSYDLCKGGDCPARNRPYVQIISRFNSRGDRVRPPLHSKSRHFPHNVLRCKQNHMISFTNAARLSSVLLWLSFLPKNWKMPKIPHAKRKKTVILTANQNIYASQPAITPEQFSPQKFPVIFFPFSFTGRLRLFQFKRGKIDLKEQTRRTFR